MPWREYSVMSQRRELVMFASDNANISHLSRNYNISRKTAYKWIKRYIQDGEKGLSDRSRRPHHSPLRVPKQIEDAVLVCSEGSFYMGWQEDTSAAYGIMIRRCSVGINYHRDITSQRKDIT